MIRQALPRISQFEAESGRVFIARPDPRWQIAGARGHEGIYSDWAMENVR
jgi:hypothetical protein